MNLFDQISEDIKKAMLARNHAELEALRGVKKEFLEAKTAKGGNGELSDEAAVRILQKMSKQGKEAAALFREQNRNDLAEEYLAQVAVYERYLPAQMSADELEKVLRDIIAQVGATSPQEMGKVMGVATKQLAGKADGRAISETVKRLLTA
ncbi:MAG: GatB/YqeY domain-containing protein [Paludibacteraceae bacterium]|nr:GatB/YqeY domain-containing protein [Bacteroidales bacterium]MDD7527919.1 GatB/YqeY domain-containing protein [Bacteroidales bacterium]MDY4512759.1 GatB/YqeY domain-containing protein [Paludibacteraceae bacterium]MDY4850200.1 GatB/YqeY domain-containing protein [Paludibacteraceae bacterium]